MIKDQVNDLVIGVITFDTTSVSAGQSNTERRAGLSIS